ncbi:MAG: hypothetical protein H8E34_05370 [Bacteroidetes bacterium]|nr:hypothetical protein [Bacteroidota bacterium]MBL6944309.1 hypothetical protein [Bacteroidales bacterium]
MEEKVLKEIREIKKLLSEMLGTSDLPTKEKFSKEAITKAAKEYRKMAIERGEWLPDDEIRKVIRKAPWRSGKVIIEKFGFTNYFKRGHTFYFSKKDLIALNVVLKKKNINLAEYCELLDDQANFEKYRQRANQTDGRKSKIRFRIPEGLEGLNSKHYPPPSEEAIINEIANYMEEVKKFDLSEYISFAEKNTYAWFKYDYSLDRYVDSKLKKYCKDWCFKFNYANNALKKIRKIESGDDRQY